MSKNLSGEAWINSRQKRAMDILVASSLLPIAVPVGAAALGLSRLIDGEGVVFTQTRIGQNGESYVIHKIRTMRDGPVDLLNDSDRVTPLGGKLRALGVDEIPQLLNVLGGSMSMVGPRVAQNGTLERMQAYLPRTLFDEWEDAYYRSRPGGASSYTSAYRETPKAMHNPTVRAQMDIADFENASFAYDSRLLAHAGAVGMKVVYSYLSGDGGKLAGEIAELAASQPNPE